MHTTQITRIKRSAALAIAAAALAAPAAPAYVADHESRVAAAVGAGQKSDTRQDLRMPDTVDAANGYRTSYQPAKPVQDLRMPDTQDFAAGRGTSTAPDVLVVKVPEPVADTGLDWTDVGIGASGVLGLTLVSLGGTALVAQRRRRPSLAH